MPSPMHVVPETMSTAATSLTQTAQELVTSVNGLAATINGAGNPWGADEQGSIFGQLYTAVLGKAFESIASHVEQVGYAGAALSQQAATYTEVETGAATQFRAMQGGS